MNQIDNKIDIIFKYDNPIFSNWGNDIDVCDWQSLNLDSQLNLGVIAIRKLTWGDFVTQLSTIITVSSALPKYNIFIGFLLLLSMNPIKALQLKDSVSKEFKQVLLKNDEGYYYLDLVKLLDVVDKTDINKTVKWFCENNIATLSEDGKKLMLNEYIVEFVYIMKR